MHAKAPTIKNNEVDLDISALNSYDDDLPVENVI